MASKDPIVCHVCGFKNQPETARCVSCGARIEGVVADYSAEEQAAKANQQTGFDVKWVAASFAIYFVVQAIALVLLPLVIPSYDPQGIAGVWISIGVWFVGGLLVGYLSPGRTFLEPAVGAAVAGIPTIFYIRANTPAVHSTNEALTGFAVSETTYLFCFVIGCLLSLMGAYLGERIQTAAKGPAKARV